MHEIKKTFRWIILEVAIVDRWFSSGSLYLFARLSGGRNHVEKGNTHLTPVGVGSSTVLWGHSHTEFKSLRLPHRWEVKTSSRTWNRYSCLQYSASVWRNFKKKIPQSLQFPFKCCELSQSADVSFVCVKADTAWTILMAQHAVTGFIKQNMSYKTNIEKGISTEGENTSDSDPGDASRHKPLLIGEKIW